MDGLWRWMNTYLVLTIDMILSLAMRLRLPPTHQMPGPRRHRRSLHAAGRVRVRRRARPRAVPLLGCVQRLLLLRRQVDDRLLRRRRRRRLLADLAHRPNPARCPPERGSPRTAPA